MVNTLASTLMEVHWRYQTIYNTSIFVSSPPVYWYLYSDCKIENVTLLYSSLHNIDKAKNLREFSAFYLSTYHHRWSSQTSGTDPSQYLRDSFSTNFYAETVCIVTTYFLSYNLATEVSTSHFIDQYANGNCESTTISFLHFFLIVFCVEVVCQEETQQSKQIPGKLASFLTNQELNRWSSVRLNLATPFAFVHC